MTDDFHEIRRAEEAEAEPLKPLCARCMDECELLPAPCAEKPERLLGAPIGMYHCPDCGAMVLAGFEHPPLCAACIAGTRDERPV